MRRILICSLTESLHSYQRTFEVIAHCVRKNFTAKHFNVRLEGRRSSLLQQFNAYFHSKRPVKPITVLCLQQPDHALLSVPQTARYPANRAETRPPDGRDITATVCNTTFNTARGRGGGVTWGRGAPDSKKRDARRDTEEEKRKKEKREVILSFVCLFIGV